MATKLQPQDIDTTQTFVLSASQFGDGAVGAPSITFSTAPTTGIYLTGTGSTRFSSLGVNVFRTHGGGAEVVFGGLQTTDGTVSAPSLTFSSDQDTGIYHIGANNVGLAVNGAVSMTWGITQQEFYISGSKIAEMNASRFRPEVDNALQLGSTTQGWKNIYLAGGTVSLPAASFSGDTNTGIYSSGADSLNFAAGGLQVVQLTSDAVYPLFHVRAPNGSAGTPMYTFDNSPTTGIYLNAANDMRFSAGGSFKFAVTSADIESNTTLNMLGNGITSVASIGIGNGSQTTPSIFFSSDTSTNTGIFWNAEDDMRFTAGGAYKMAIKAGSIDVNTGFNMLSNTIVGIGAGSVSLPALAFANSTNTGFYSAGAGTLNFTTAGVARASLDSTSLYLTVPVLTPNGSASVPSLSFTGFPTTGWFNNGTNSMRASVNGTQMFSIDTATINLESLTYIQDGTSGAPSIAFAADHDTGIMRAGTNQVAIVCGAAQVGIFNSDAGNANQLTLNNNPGNTTMYGLSAAHSATGTNLNADCRGVAISVNDGNSGDPYMLWAIGGPTRYWTMGIDNSNSDVLAVSTTAGGTAKPGTGDIALFTSNGFQVIDGTVANPSISFINQSSTGIFRNASGQMQFVAGGSAILTLGLSGVSVLSSVAGDISLNRILPNTDATLNLGSAGQRWNTLFASNGTINTSHSSTKSNIVEIDPTQVEIPQGVEYDRDGRRYIGYLNDSLPDVARPYDESGNVLGRDNYENAVIGILCAKLRKAFEEIENLKVLIQK